MKLCKDCKFHVKVVTDWCEAKRYTRTSVVTGETEWLGSEYCSFMRFERGSCGPEAKLFQPKAIEVPKATVKEDLVEARKFSIWDWLFR